MSDLSGKTGAASKLTVEITDKICAAIELGSYRRYAALGAGISPQTLTKWYDLGGLDKDAGVDSIFAWFYDRINESEAKLEQKLTKRWVTALNEDDMGWKGIEAYLAKRFKDDWGKSPVEIHAAVADLRKSPEFNAILNLITAMVPDDKQEELAEKLAALGEKDERDG